MKQQRGRVVRRVVGERALLSFEWAGGLLALKGTESALSVEVEGLRRLYWWLGRRVGDTAAAVSLMAAEAVVVEGGVGDSVG